MQLFVLLVTLLASCCRCQSPFGYEIDIQCESAHYLLLGRIRQLAKQLKAVEAVVAELDRNITVELSESD
jgi:hypothetical protein